MSRVTTVWHYSAHALDRADEMGVPVGEVTQTLDDPESDYPSGPRYPGCRVATRGRLAIPYHPEDRVVLTVLWNTAPLGGRAFDRNGHTSPYDQLAPAPSPVVAAPAPQTPSPVRAPDPTEYRRAAAKLARHGRDTAPGRCRDCLGSHATPFDALDCDDMLGAFADELDRCLVCDGTYIDESPVLSPYRCTCFDV